FGPFFNDAQILINVCPCYTRTRQPLTRKWKQLLQDERCAIVTLPVNPLEVSIEPMPRGAEEVQLGIVKHHSLRNVAIHVRKRNHQAGEESRIRNLVDNRWTRR